MRWMCACGLRAVDSARPTLDGAARRHPRAIALAGALLVGAEGACASHETANRAEATTDAAVRIESQTMRTEAPRPSRAPGTDAPIEPAAPPSLTTAGARQAPRLPTEEELGRYAFLAPSEPIRVLSDVAPPPADFERVAVTEGSFGAYVRSMPLQPEDRSVQSFDGRELLMADDPRVFAVSALDVSRADLQQCADSVIRWHAEWLWATGRASAATYPFVSGDWFSFSSFASGVRPVVDGREVRFEMKGKRSSDRASFRSYLEVIFMYASTISLARSASEPVAPAELDPGDFFILPGGPGHVVLVLDVARNPAGEARFLLGQGYMPAQSFHVLRAPSGDPWFSSTEEGVTTPFWPVPFPGSSLRRFKPVAR